MGIKIGGIRGKVENDGKPTAEKDGGIKIGGSGENSSTENTPKRAAAGINIGTAAGKTNEKGEEKPTSVPLVKPPKESKPRRKRTTTAKPIVDPKEIATFLVAISGIVASRQGMEIMLLTQGEAMSLAIPLSAMIAKNEKLANLGEYADAVALITAVTVIFAPRLIMVSQISKQKRQVKKQRFEVVKNDAIRESTKPTGQDDAKRTDNSQNDVPDIFSVLPPI